ncbi:UNVERIFIED_CONTAM: hypothetical protein PYX00_002015 [Menopon gallinae]|uniref:Transmembrane protein 256 homolog n=1 Tax=Menopon gallinae TaxID=328185 RepID=A0AAW2IFL5_9NEOP
MVFSDIWNTTYGVVASVANYSKQIGGGLLESAKIVRNPPPEVRLPSNLQNLDVLKLVNIGHPVIRFAALSGAMATVLGAYGAHTLPMKDEYEERKHVFKTANQYHFYHTLAVLAVPLSRYPKTTASMMTLGMLLFCGTCYYHAFTGDQKLKTLTPVGGIFLIMGWLSMIL